MYLLMIATIKENGEIIGYRIFDADSKENKFINVPKDNVKEVLMSKKAVIENLSLIDGELVGTNGSIERYPVVNRQGKLISDKSPLIIINAIEDKGYTVVDYKGVVKKVGVFDVVKYAKEHGIANGKVVLRDNVEFISSIVGSYPVVKLTKSNKSYSKEDENIIKITLKNSKKPSNKAERNADVNIKAEINETDVFRVMTPEQKKVIRLYYMWYTVDMYKSMVKSTRLKLAPGKVETMAELRGNENWEFGGMLDTGFYGGATCTLGHKLRYVYFAIPEGEEDNKDAWLRFGHDCASDFFEISKKDMDNLNKTRSRMSEEIKTISDILTNNLQEEYYNKARLLYDIITELGTKEKIIKVFGNKVGNTLIQFMMVRIPFPMSLVIEAGKRARVDRVSFYKELFPEYSNEIDVIYNVFRDRTYILEYIRRYLDFIVDNKIEGDYAYNPLDETIKRRDVGRYNKKTRALRYSFLQTVKRYALCEKYSLDEIEALLYSVRRLYEVYNKIAPMTRGTELSKANTVEASSYLYNKATNIEEMDKLDIRIFIYNTIGTFKLLYTPHDRLMKYSIKYSRLIGMGNIYDFKESIENINIDDVVDEYNNLLDEFKSMKERQREEKERKEREEREERERREKEEKESDGGEDRTDILRKLMESRDDIVEDYGIKVAKAILDTGKKYKDLTKKQKWRIDRTIEIYEGKVKNNKYTLDERKDILDKVNLLIDNKDSDEMKYVLKEEPKIIDIAKTVLKYKRCSDRQLKHIENAVKIFNKRREA